MKYFIFSIVTLLSTVIAKAEWPPSKIHEARAYVYDYTQEYNEEFRNQGKANDRLLRDGRLHSGVINDGGAKLNKDQIERLMKAMKSDEKVVSKKCHYPHHGFVFYDEEGKPIGHLQLCFGCLTKDSSPNGADVSNIDWAAMEKLFKELDLPILGKDEDYTKLYLEKNKAK